MSTVQVQLNRPEHAAVISAIQRLAAAFQLEASQLQSIWGQSGTAEELLRMRGTLDKMGQRFLEDVNRSIVVANEMPRGALVQP
jgi:hypothetical protein